MEQTVVSLCYHATAIDTHTTDACGSPDGVAREKVVILGSTQEAYDTELHNHLVDHLLCLLLGDNTVLEVALDVDIQESRDTTDRHSCTVLVLNGTEVTEVGPLDSLTSVGSGLGYVETVRSTHLLELLQCIDLVGDFLTATYDLLGELLDVDTLVETLLLLDKVCCTIESYTTIVTDDTATTISVGQTCDDVSVTCSLDIIVVGSEHTLVVSLAILGEDSLGSGIQLIAISLQRRLYHTDTTLGEDTTLQRSIGLKTNDNLALLVNISCAIGAYALRQLCLGIINALLALHLEHLRKDVPKLLCLLTGASQETLVAIVWLVVVLDEVTNINLVLPRCSLKIIL